MTAVGGVESSSYSNSHMHHHHQSSPTTAAAAAAASRYDSYSEPRSDDYEQDGASGAGGDVTMEDGVGGDGDVDGDQPKKKRRFIKDQDKKYDCPHSGCGKKYSRAEHLYRHQLNHNPKEVFHCDYPGCDRTFVRSDLCQRHKERHTAKGSHLHRKDIVYHNNQRAAAEAAAASRPGPDMTAMPPPPNITPVYHYTPTSEPYMSPTAPMRPYTSGPEHMAAGSGPPVGLPPLNTVPRSHYEPSRSSYSSYPPPVSAGNPQLAPIGGHASSYDSSMMAQGPPSVDSYAAPPAPPSLNVVPPAMHSPTPGGRPFTAQPYPSPVTNTSQVFQSPGSYASMTPGSQYPYPVGYGMSGPASTPGLVMPSTASMNTSEAPPPPLPAVTGDNRSNPLMDFGAFDQLNPGFAMPVFGGETPYMRSPSIHVDDGFMNYLFSSSGMDFSGPSPPDAQPTPAALAATMQELEEDIAEDAQQELPNSMAKLDINLPENTISQSKQAHLVSIVQRWHDIDQNTGHWTKDQILSGDMEDAEHVMSLQMLRTYIASFWVHIHHQMPILHRPTFNPDTCPLPLLLSMICLGATCLERTHPPKVTQVSAELSFFIAYHVRWEVFKDAEFRPTAKLWTFQTMLLLELFEKMYSTRPLHERAHIHHATTLTVMRRGSSLVGRSSAMDSLLGADDPTRTPPGPDGSINTSGQNTADGYWNRWITAEATRRAAFAAFTIDSTHATLFGHSAVMSPHDLRLPLPCDEALWSATNGREVQRIESSLAANGFRSVTFLDGLKMTLAGKPVRTNTFGRVVLMAGLLNVSWHMNQRDLQVASLGAGSTLGNSSRWRSPLTRAFDHWSRDFDDSLSRNGSGGGGTNEPWSAGSGSAHGSGGSGSIIGNNAGTTSSGPASRNGSLSNSTSDLLGSIGSSSSRRRRSSIDRRDNVFESRTCLHSLAHMAMHVDIVDCQVFAGAEHALGRPVTDSDRAAVQQRMRIWATTARARDAVWYAIRFLVEVLLTDEGMEGGAAQGQQNDGSSSDNVTHQRSGHSTATHSAAPNAASTAYAFRYSARDDYLLNRPWVLYFATLIVWAYGYALDGPLASSSNNGNNTGAGSAPPVPTPSSATSTTTPASATSSAFNYNNNNTHYANPNSSNYCTNTGLVPSTPDQKIQDLHSFLRRMASVNTPEDLGTLHGERNKCLGLLLLLKESFAQPRWELLHEASESLGCCAGMLVPGLNGAGGAGTGGRQGGSARVKSEARG